MSVNNTPTCSKYTETITHNINQVDSMWNRIQQMTYGGNKDVWCQLKSQDILQFKLNFKEAYLEHCKIWLCLFNEFTEKEETWVSLMEIKSKIYEYVKEDADEVLFLAVDARRNKIFKLIDWNTLETGNL